MTTAGAIRAARNAPDRAARIRTLAALMRESRLGLEDGLTIEAAQAAGFTLAEIAAYRDDALAIACQSAAVVPAPEDGRATGDALVREAQAIRVRREPGR